MHSTEVKTQRRLRIWRIVVLAVLIIAIGEPIVMYFALAHQKEQRRATAELSFGKVSARMSIPKAATP